MSNYNQNQAYPPPTTATYMTEPPPPAGYPMKDDVVGQQPPLKAKTQSRVVLLYVAAVYWTLAFEDSYIINNCLLITYGFISVFLFIYVWYWRYCVLIDFNYLNLCSLSIYFDLLFLLY
ncbi:hypothetical protein ACJIZ3_007503 [Penstemon smallii]|uniref:Uncharacterized protein n=1 Tax=Penstemon smallii TaxID=265156 RepID=A0ABD3SB10_9LAMI